MIHSTYQIVFNCFLKEHSFMFVRLNFYAIIKFSFLDSIDKINNIARYNLIDTKYCQMAF